MPDEPKKDRPPLSEISHLFLSSVRARHTGGAPAPQRKPPAKKQHETIDLTPEEFSEVFSESQPQTTSAAAPAQAHRPIPRVSAIIGTHLNGKLFDRVKEYAGHLCTSGKPIGLIEVDSAEFRVMLFERADRAGISIPANVAPPPAEPFDLRRMSEVLEELSWDVDRWILLMPNPRGNDARPILRLVDHWVLLSTCDHDGIVGCYRTLKGLADEIDRPRLSLALLDAQDQDQADAVFAKLASVCQQFLHRPLESEPAVRRDENVAEHLALCCRATRSGDASSGVQWQVISNFLTSASREQVTPMEPTPDQSNAELGTTPSTKKHVVADIVMPEPSYAHSGKTTVADARDTVVAPRVVTTTATASAPAIAQVSSQSSDDVVELPGNEAGSIGIIGAILRNTSARLVECPVKAPMCPDASLAVGSDRRLVLVAAAREGLGDLRGIARAYQWLMENRGLVAMALPQFAIDAHQHPRMMLLVDQADISADILQPMLQSSSVTVQAYRKLRWGGRTGLLLNAA